MRRTSNNQRGFTIVELIVAIVVMGILIGVVLGTLFDFYQDTSTSVGRTTQDSDTLSVLRSIEKDLTTSFGYSATITAGSPLGSGNNATDGTDWSYCGIGNNGCSRSMDYRVLLARHYATDISATHSSGANRKPIFINTGGGCNASASNTIVENAFIYFVAPDRNDPSINNLYRRTIVHSNYGSGSICGTPAQRTSCSSSRVGQPITGGVGGSSTCLTSDALLLRNIKSFDIKYFATANATSPYSDNQIYNLGGSPSPTVLADAANRVSGAKSILITAETVRRINGDAFTSSANIRISVPE